MPHRQHLPHPITLTRLLTLCLIGSVSFSQAVHAQVRAYNINHLQLTYNAPTPPDQGAPDGRQRGGASRGQCNDYEALTALVPVTDGRVWSLTASEHPTFWFYVPTALDPQTSIEFVLQDASDNYIYRSFFAAPNTESGLISFSIPTSARSLEKDQPYYWTMSLYCDASRPSASVFVRGTIQRTELDPALEAQITASSPLEQAMLYAANGIWHEALSILADLRRTNPNEPQAAEAWATLLQQANLGSLSDKDFAPCCTALEMSIAESGESSRFTRIRYR